MAILSAKDVTVSTETIKTLVIGDYGTGKSIFASTFPTPGFVFDFSNGILGYRGKNFDYAQYPYTNQGWIEFEKDFREVCKAVHEGKYITVIMDELTSMQELAMAQALALDPKRSVTQGPVWNIHYGIVKNLIGGRVRQLMSLPCNIVVICHSELVKNEETGSIIGIRPNAPGKLAIDLPGYFDEVYFAETMLIENKNQWVLRTAPRGIVKARSRLCGTEGLVPELIPNNYPALVRVINEGVKRKKAALEAQAAARAKAATA